MELNKDTVYIFRNSMQLKLYQVDRLFDKLTRPENYPEYIKYSSSGIRGLKKYADIKVNYDYEMFKTKSPKVARFYPRNDKLTLKFMNEITDEEFRAAFFSGYVRFDSRGYTFDITEEAIKEMERYECS